jgi:Domain of unknown function (DUF4398)
MQTEIQNAMPTRATTEKKASNIFAVWRSKSVTGARNIASQFNGYIVCCSLAVLAFGCVAMPRQSHDIDIARAAIHEVESLPSALEVAGMEINAAHTALLEAEKLANKRAPSEEINSAATLAKRHAEIAQQQIALEEAKRTIESSEQERQVNLSQTTESQADETKIGDDRS